MATINSTNLVEGIREDIRDKLRADAAFLTILGLTSSNKHNYIFSNRPTTGKTSFKNPRVFCDDGFRHEPFRAGENPDGINADEINGQITCITADTPKDLNENALSRIKNLLHLSDFTVDDTGQKGKYEILLTDSIKDPDKPKTKYGRALIKAILT